jgi:putative hydrolases of HD superfamily
MEIKAELNTALVERAAGNGLIAAFMEFNHLKHIYRQGWLKRGISKEQCETVAEHTLGVVMLAWLVGDQLFPGVSRDKLMRMAMIHDLGEVFTGDLIPADNVSPGEKRRRERESVKRVVSRLPLGRDYLDLWEEYEAGRTNEARIVRQLDRLEMACQATVYEYQDLGPLDEFFRSAGEGVYTPEIFQLLEAVKKLR